MPLSRSARANALACLQGLLAGEQLRPQAPTGNIIEIKEHDSRPSAKRTSKDPLPGTASCFRIWMRAVMPELKLFLTSLRLIKLDSAQSCSIEPAIMRPATWRDGKPSISDALNSEQRQWFWFHRWNISAAAKQGCIERIASPNRSANSRFDLARIWRSHVGSLSSSQRRFGSWQCPGRVVLRRTCGECNGRGAFALATVLALWAS